MYNYELRVTSYEVRGGKDGVRGGNFCLSEQRKLRSFAAAPERGQDFDEVREVSPVVARLPISLTSPRARILCIAVKLRPVWDGRRDYTYPTNCHLWFFRDSRVANQPVPGEGAG